MMGFCAQGTKAQSSGVTPVRVLPFEGPAKAVEVRDDSCYRRQDFPYVLVLHGPIDRALGMPWNFPVRLSVEVSRSGGWTHDQANWSGYDVYLDSMSLGSQTLIGNIIGRSKSLYDVSLSEAGSITAKESGTTTDLRSFRFTYPIKGSVTWEGDETLDLNSGTDSWKFHATLSASYRLPSHFFPCTLKATLDASAAGKREILGKPPPTYPSYFYLIDPFVLGEGNLSNIDLVTLLPNISDLGIFKATGLVADGTSAAIALFATSSSSAVTFVTNNGTTLLPYSPDFLTTAPNPLAHDSSLQVSPVQIGTLFYAFALVQSPAEGVTTFSFDKPITVTATQSPAFQQAGSMAMVEPPAIFVHGLWGDFTSLETMESLLLKTTSWGKRSPMTSRIDYKNDVAFDDQGAQSGVQTLEGAISSIMGVLDDQRIVGGRVDIVAHSMGGLVARAYAKLPSYYSLRDRKTGQFHQIITLDTPEAGSALAAFLLEPKVSGGKLRQDAGFFPTTVWNDLCRHDANTTIATCFRKVHEPIDDGAVASLVPGSINLDRIPPPEIVGSVWRAVDAEVPHPSSPPTGESAEQWGIENLIAAVCPNPTSCPCPNPTSCPQITPPTIAGILNDGGKDDAIVTLSSQVYGGPSQHMTFDGLAHNTIPYAGLLADLATGGLRGGLSYETVVTSRSVAAVVGCWLDTTCDSTALAANDTGPMTDVLPSPLASSDTAGIPAGGVAGDLVDLQISAPDKVMLATPFEIKIVGGKSAVKSVHYWQAAQYTQGYSAEEYGEIVRTEGNVTYVKITPRYLGQVEIALVVTFVNHDSSPQDLKVDSAPSNVAPDKFVGDREFLNKYHPNSIPVEPGGERALHPAVTYPNLPHEVLIDGFVQYRIISNDQPPVIELVKDAKYPESTNIRGIRPGIAMVEARFGSAVHRFSVKVHHRQ